MREPRWTLITGASSGIGAALARAFAADGDHVVLTARRAERLEALGAEIRAAGRRAEVVAADLAEANAAGRLLAVVAARGIELDTLVNNAGFGLRGRFATLPHDRQMEMVALNIAALTDLSRLVLPELVRRRRGGILNVASTAAFQAGPFMALYYASKAFVLSLSEALHEEVKADGVTVTALCPGPTDTEFAANADLEGSRLFRVGAMSAEAVAAQGLAGYRAGMAIVVPGTTNKLTALGSKIVPRVLSRRIARRLQDVS